MVPEIGESLEDRADYLERALITAPSLDFNQECMILTVAAVYLCVVESAIDLLQERGRADFDVDAKFGSVVLPQVHDFIRHLVEHRPANLVPFNQLHLSEDPAVLRWAHHMIATAYVSAQQ